MITHTINPSGLRNFCGDLCSNDQPKPKSDEETRARLSYVDLKGTYCTIGNDNAPASFEALSSCEFVRGMAGF
jgi:hypothetical protein